MADAGANEVKVATTGAFQCWMYGNYMPNAAVATNYDETLVAALYPAKVWPAAWLGLKALETNSWMVCKIRTAVTAANNQLLIPMQ
jgi:hypothetical protein